MAECRVSGKARTNESISGKPTTRDMLAAC
jgi:hypothetical protein